MPNLNEHNLNEHNLNEHNLNEKSVTAVQGTQGQKGFQQYQQSLANMIRSPIKAQTLEFPANRLNVYRTLFFSNIRNLLAGMFPVSVEVLGGERWDQLIRHFIEHHRAKTPLFLEMGQEWIQFLEQSSNNKQPWMQGLPPYLVSLSHYEWVEIAVDVINEERDEEPCPQAQRVIVDKADILDRSPQLSSAAVVLHYPYPVHRISGAMQEVEPQHCFLVVYRDAELKVRFLELNALSYQLISQVQQGTELTGKDLVSKVLQSAGLSESVQAAGEQQIREWHSKGIVF